MEQRKKGRFLVSIIVILVILMIISTPVFAANNIYKVGMKSSDIYDLQSNLFLLKYLHVSPTGYYGSLTESAVKNFQEDFNLKSDGIAGPNTISKLLDIVNGDEVFLLQLQLKNLNYLNVSPTGYYGSLTEQAVINFQKDYGLYVDGIAGSKTKEAIKNAARNKGINITSRSSSNKNDLMMPWFSGVINVLKRGDVATVTDVDTGISFNIKRICGTNHADVETLTTEDTKILKDLYGGEWSWERRAVLVDVNGTLIAGSMAGMPHAGRDDKPYGEWVSGRSGGYGKGQNLDGVKGNGMSGVIDLHFYGSKTHSTNRVDSKHQTMVKKAADSVK
jgi:peptidoglycan hydrolase-like protein with peptidoglycan-binding domain